MAPNGNLDQEVYEEGGAFKMDRPVDRQVNLIKTINDDRLGQLPRRSSCPDLKTKDSNSIKSTQRLLKRPIEMKTAISSYDVRNGAENVSQSPYLSQGKASNNSVSSSFSRPLSSRLNASNSIESIVSLTEKRLHRQPRSGTPRQAWNKISNHSKSDVHLDTVHDSPRTQIVDESFRRVKSSPQTQIVDESFKHGKSSPLPQIVDESFNHVKSSSRTQIVDESLKYLKPGMKLLFVNKSKESLMVENELRSENSRNSSHKSISHKTRSIKDVEKTDNETKSQENKLEDHSDNRKTIYDVLDGPVQKESDENIDINVEYIEMNELTEAYDKCTKWLKGLEEAQRSGGWSLEDTTMPSFIIRK